MAGGFYTIGGQKYTYEEEESYTPLSWTTAVQRTPELFVDIGALAGSEQEEVKEAFYQLGKVPSKAVSTQQPWVAELIARAKAEAAGQRPSTAPVLQAGVMPDVGDWLSQWWAEVQGRLGTQVTPGMTPEGTEAELMTGALPTVAGVSSLAALGTGAIANVGKAGITVGVLRALWQKFGPAAVTVIKKLAPWLSIAAIISAIFGGDDDDKVLRRRRKRYTIGHNPRVRTLQKVSAHCQRMLKKHDKVIREFLPRKTRTYGIPPSKALSAIEKAAIRG